MISRGCMVYSLAMLFSIVAPQASDTVNNFTVMLKRIGHTGEVTDQPKEGDMDIQKIISDVQAKAGANGDGKVNIDDVRGIAHQHGANDDQIKQAESVLDVDHDGNVDLDDAKAKFGDLGGMANDLKNKLFGGK